MRSAIKRVPGVLGRWGDRHDRYGLRAVDKRMKSVLGSKMPETVLITAAYSQWNVPDAVDASAVSWEAALPVVYVNKRTDRRHQWEFWA